MSADGLRYRSYRWRGSDEWLAEIGSGPCVLILPPLFEELNRCRALISGLMRGLAAEGLHAVFPDLPGTGESPLDLGEVTWGDWLGAVSFLVGDLSGRGQSTVIASIRGGCLLDNEMPVPSWRFSPVAGAALVRDLIRTRQSTLPDKPKAAAMEAEARAHATEFAGYMIPSTIFSPLADASVPPRERVRTVRLATDAADADLKIEGKPLWRQAEPGNDPALAAALAADLASWARTCAG